MMPLPLVVLEHARKNPLQYVAYLLGVALWVLYRIRHDAALSAANEHALAQCVGRSDVALPFPEPSSPMEELVNVLVKREHVERLSDRAFVLLADHSAWYRRDWSKVNERLKPYGVRVVRHARTRSAPLAPEHTRITVEYASATEQPAEVWYLHLCKPRGPHVLWEPLGHVPAAERAQSRPRAF